MKIIETNNFKKIAGKIPKSELEPYNPFAVCKSKINEKKEPAKLERCIKHIKKQNREENKDSKPAMEGEVYSPKTENEFLRRNKGKLERKGVPKKPGKNWDDVLNKMRKTKYEPQYAENKENIKESVDYLNTTLKKK